jgi:flavin reductase
MPTEKQSFRDAMARLGAAVNIVTTDGEGGRAGFTASAVCSVTDAPPTLLVCLNRSASTNSVFLRNMVLCVNTLASPQRELSDVFAGLTGRDGVERFGAGAWGRLATGAPVLEGALVAFDCRVVEVVVKGSHSVLFAEVEAVRIGDAEAGALIYYGRDYHAVGEG